MSISTTTHPIRVPLPLWESARATAIAFDRDTLTFEFEPKALVTMRAAIAELDRTNVRPASWSL